MGDLARKYWGQAIDDYVTTCERETKLSRKVKEKIVDHILNDDSLWQNIDETIGFWILEEAKYEGK